MAEFDYQWKNLHDDKNLELNDDRIREFLDYVHLPADWFKGKLCLDAGCGSGRWTWVMMQLGAKVISFDKSPEAVTLCSKINRLVYQDTFKSLRTESKYLIIKQTFHFVLCWGVLHHTSNPISNFITLAKMVKPGGYMHIMVYHRLKQIKYYPFRKLWKHLSVNHRRLLCNALAVLTRKSVHGWWDALNPELNHSYYPHQVKRWFQNTGFEDIVLTRKYSINMRGRKS